MGNSKHDYVINLGGLMLLTNYMFILLDISGETACHTIGGVCLWSLSTSVPKLEEEAEEY